MGKSKTTKCQLRIDVEPWLKRKLEAIARAEDRSVSSVVRQAVMRAAESRTDVQYSSPEDIGEATRKAIAADRSRGRNPLRNYKSIFDK